MKKQNSIYIALVIILLASPACYIGGIAPKTESGQTIPVSTTVPSQEADSNDGPAGPETIDLTNPALYIIPSAPAFTFDMTIKYTGVDSTGVAREVSDIRSSEVQTQPQTTQHFFSLLGLMEGDADSGFSSETVIIGDQMTSAQLFSDSGGTPEPFCITTLASSVKGPGELESTFKLQKWVTGQAPRVESGIEVNGFVTDKYELSSENFVAFGAELISAFVYVARDGGFITLYERQHREKTGYSGFDPDQFTDITTAYNFIPVEDGSLDIAMPAACDSAAGLAGEFPVMDGAANVSISLWQVSYQIQKTAAEVGDFYRADMPKRGWALTDDTIVGPYYVTLVFTRDGKNFIVKVVGGGDYTVVTIMVTNQPAATG